MMVNVPLCRRHRHHWLKRTIFDVTWFVLFIVVALGGGLTLEASWLPESWRANIKSGLLPAILVILAGWPGVHLLISFWMIEPRRIIHEEIVLQNVHPSFEDAVRRWRIGEFDDKEPAILVGSESPPKPNSVGDLPELGGANSVKEISAR